VPADILRSLTVRERTTIAATKAPHEGSVTRELIHAAKSLRAYFEQVLAREGEALSTFLVLDAVAREGAKSQRELAEGVRIEGATMTRHLDRLEADGLVSRQRDPADRRAILISLTRAGAQTHRRLRERIAAAREACWKGIGSREREVVRRVAVQLSSNVDALTAGDREEELTHA